jgi:hypothetical protein
MHVPKETSIGSSGSVFVPVIVAGGAEEKMVNVSARLISGPAIVPGLAPSNPCGPISTVPFTTKVPLYGPVATPVALYSMVELPSGLQTALSIVTSSAKRSSPVRGRVPLSAPPAGAACAAARPRREASTASRTNRPRDDMPTPLARGL